MSEEKSIAADISLDSDESSEDEELPSFLIQKDTGPKVGENSKSCRLGEEKSGRSESGLRRMGGLMADVCSAPF